MRFVTNTQRFECKSPNVPGGHMGQFKRINSDYGSLRAALGHNMFREARFESIKTPSMEVIVFLKKHHRSLRRLEFFNVELEGHREEFLQPLRDYMSLDHLEWHDFVVDEVDSLTESEQNISKTKKYESGLFIGKKRVSAALDALLSDAPRMGPNGSDIMDFGFEGESSRPGWWSEHSLIDGEEYVWDERSR